MWMWRSFFLIVRLARRPISRVSFSRRVNNIEVKRTEVRSSTRGEVLWCHEISEIGVIQINCHRLRSASQPSTPSFGSIDNDPEFLIVDRENTFSRSKFLREKRYKMKDPTGMRLRNDSRDRKTRTIIWETQGLEKSKWDNTGALEKARNKEWNQAKEQGLDKPGTTSTSVWVRACKGAAI